MFEQRGRGAALVDCSRVAPRAIVLLVGLAAVLVPAAAAAESAAAGGGHPPRLGRLTQLPGERGCVVDASRARRSCTGARALDGPGPFLGSRALAVSPDGKNVYVAASKSDSIAIFKRDKHKGTLTQANGAAGCIAAKGTHRCARAIGIDAPNSVAVSPDGRNVYATSRRSGSITIFGRIRKNGRLKQLDGNGCIATAPIPGCDAGRAMLGSDVVVVSPDGRNVYVGAFFGNSVAAFGRRAGGSLHQLDGVAGCSTNSPTAGCSTGLALAAPEGMAISDDGRTVFVASAVSNAAVTFARNRATGVLTQAVDGSGCIVDEDLSGCTTGAQLSGANAVEVSPDDENAYVTSLFSNSVTSFTRASDPSLTQNPGTTGCLVYLIAVGCSLGHALEAPEGVAVSPDGANVYAASFDSGAIAVLDRDTDTGGVMQKPGKPGCLTRAPNSDCKRGRALRGASSLALSPDGRHLYVTAFRSDAVAAFRRRVSPSNKGARRAAHPRQKGQHGSIG